jgi:hypothetical protein
MRWLRSLSYGIRPRIYIILRGGLGNQLHQIAAGVKYGENSNGKVIIYPHIVDNAKNPERRGFFRAINLSKLFPTASIAEANFLEVLILRALNSRNFKYISKLVIHDDNFFKQLDNPIVILRGWFQSFDYLPAFINFLSLKTLSDSNCNQVTLHVRLTDFLTIDTNPLQRKYYQNALSVIQKKVDINQIRCFSDDIDGAKGLLPEGLPYNFPETLRPYSAPELLAELANSSFLVTSKSSLCWWAANSVSSGGGIVISPWKGSAHNPEWIKISS